jgi:hypothetical protein
LAESGRSGRHLAGKNPDQAKSERLNGCFRPKADVRQPALIARLFVRREFQKENGVYSFYTLHFARSPISDDLNC